MTRKNDVAADILETLLETDVPLTAYAISKKLNRSIQLVDYHLGIFLGSGVVEVNTDAGKKLFYLKPILYDQGSVDAFKDALTPIVEVIAKECESPAEVLAVLQASLTLFTRNISKEVLNSGLNSASSKDIPVKNGKP